MIQTLHIDIFTLALLLGAFQGLSFIFLLWVAHPKRRIHNVHLCIMLFVYSLLLFQHFLVLSGYIYELKAFVISFMPLDIVMGPAFYAYVRSMTRPDLQRSKYSLLVHYSVIIFPFLILFPFLSLDFHTKLAFLEGGQAIEVWPKHLHVQIITMMVLAAVVFSIYVFLSIRLLIAHNWRIKNVFSYREKITLGWLGHLLVFAGVFWLAMVVYFLVLDDKANAQLVLKMFSVLSILAVFYIGTMGLLQPRIYHREDQSLLDAGLDQVPLIEVIESSLDDKQGPVTSQAHSLASQEQEILQPRASEAPLLDISADKSDLKKYQKSILSDEDMGRIAAKIRGLMDSESLYLVANITMPKLASRLGVSPNYLSQTLNSTFKESFFDFINRQRIEYSKQLLLDESKSSLTVLDIAMASAFNSKSAFYSAFKKYVGVTPTQFKKNHTCSGTLILVTQ